MLYLDQLKKIWLTCFNIFCWQWGVIFLKNERQEGVKDKKMTHFSKYLWNFFTILCIMQRTQ